MKIVIVGKAPSVNGLYKLDSRSGHIYLDDKGRSYKDIVSEFIKKSGKRLPDYMRGLPLTITYKFYFKSVWDDLSDTPTTRDVDGPIKAVQDAVCKGLGFDDSYVFKIIVEKRESELERSVVIIKPYDYEPDPDD